MPLITKIIDNAEKYHIEDRLVGNALRRITGYEGCAANDQTYSAISSIAEDIIREAINLGVNVNYIKRILSRLNIS